MFYMHYLWSYVGSIHNEYQCLNNVKGNLKKHSIDVDVNMCEGNMHIQLRYMYVPVLWIGLCHVQMSNVPRACLVLLHYVMTIQDYREHSTANCLRSYILES